MAGIPDSIGKYVHMSFPHIWFTKDSLTQLYVMATGGITNPGHRRSDVIPSVKPKSWGEYSQIEFSGSINRSEDHALRTPNHNWGDSVGHFSTASIALFNNTLKFG